MSTVEVLGEVDAAAFSAWALGLPFECWPQQNRLPDGRLRPAMVNALGAERAGPEWRDFAARAAAFSAEVLARLPALAGVEAYNPMLSVVMPGHRIEPHWDAQPADWVTRVHVPLTTNERAVFISGGERVHMRAGLAYRVDTRATHEIRNDGEGARVHFMFDARRPPC